jgi:hypothetical protein
LNISINGYILPKGITVDRDFKSDIWKVFNDEQTLEVLQNPISQSIRIHQRLQRNFMNKKTITKKKYEMQIAGRLWEIPEITFVERNGRTFLNQKEIKKWNDAVANVICSEDIPLSPEEFKFLVNIADKKYAEVAALLKIDPSTITKWLQKDDDLSFANSFLLKMWFWTELFEGNNPKTVKDLLSASPDRAVSKDLVEVIKSA